MKLPEQMDDYRRIAALYDRATRSFLHGPRREIVAACTRLGLRRILDVGCGTGVLASMLHEKGIAVTGLDASAAMLARAIRGNTPPDAPSASGASPVFIRGDAAKPPFVPHSFDALIYALILHETAADADALLRTGFTLAPLALVLEWRMPERNLDLLATFWVHIVERLAGKNHYRQFRSFMRTGGLRGLARRTGADILSEMPLAGNSLVLAVLHCPEAKREQKK